MLSKVAQKIILDLLKVLSYPYKRKWLIRYSYQFKHWQCPVIWRWHCVEVVVFMTFQRLLLYLSSAWSDLTIPQPLLYKYIYSMWAVKESK
jgi:hypothetical protein